MKKIVLVIFCFFWLSSFSQKKKVIKASIDYILFEYLPKKNVETIKYIEQFTDIDDYVACERNSKRINEFDKLDLQLNKFIDTLNYTLVDTRTKGITTKEFPQKKPAILILLKPLKTNKRNVYVLTLSITYNFSASLLVKYRNGKIEFIEESCFTESAKK